MMSERRARKDGPQADNVREIASSEDKAEGESKLSKNLRISYVDGPRGHSKNFYSTLADEK